ncbi:hypothetical protein [Streptomyces sp. B6B3]|uniref:hypothetical protein n=1 Tax=Streptomyces sp. B6B3 TaxID=3153570 RepID=UPI00325CDCC5
MPEPAAPSTHPEWLPSPAAGIQTVPCGRWWDGVRVDSYDGIRALAHLQADTGPIIEDVADRTFMWLVPVGAAAGWRLPCVHVLGSGRWVSVPPAAADGVLVWRGRPPTSGSGLTPPEKLRDALAMIFPPVPGAARRGR